MPEKPTAGYTLENSAGEVGIIQEFDITYEGDTEDISGLGGVTTEGLVRRKGWPVDVGAILTCSGKIDEDADGYETFSAAMKARTPDQTLDFVKEGAGVAYTGHADSYNETASRSEGVWNFSLTFYVNSEDDVPG